MNVYSEKLRSYNKSNQKQYFKYNMKEKKQLDGKSGEGKKKG